MILDAGTERAKEILSILSKQDFYRGLFENKQYIVVIGGDGFLLETVGKYGLDCIYLPLNAGHLGFLLNDTKDMDRVCRYIKEWRLSVFEYPTLLGYFYLEDGRQESDIAINDIYIERASGQTARLDVYLDDNLIVESLVADGIIISSALGSTGYNFSAGGSICHPATNVMSITAISPHHPRLPSFVVPGNSTIRVVSRQGDKRPVRAVADGRAVENVREVVVPGYGRSKFKVAYLEGYNFTRQLVKKILRRY